MYLKFKIWIIIAASSLIASPTPSPYISVHTSLLDVVPPVSDFYAWFCMCSFENISGLSGVKVSKSFKEFLKVYIFFFLRKFKISWDLSNISLECLLLNIIKDSNNWFINININWISEIKYQIAKEKKSSKKEWFENNLYYYI